MGILCTHYEHVSHECQNDHYPLHTKWKRASKYISWPPGPISPPSFVTNCTNSIIATAKWWHFTRNPLLHDAFYSKIEIAIYRDMWATLKLFLLGLVVANLKRYDPNLKDTSRTLDMAERQELATEKCNIVLYPEFCHESVGPLVQPSACTMCNCTLWRKEQNDGLFR